MVGVLRFDWRRASASRTLRADQPALHLEMLLGFWSPVWVPGAL